MADESHTIMDGKVHVYRRENSSCWQCSVYLSGRNYRAPTRQSSLVRALDFAREWYLDRAADDRVLRRGGASAEVSATAAPPTAARTTVSAKPKAPTEPAGPTFREVAAIFVAEFELITRGAQCSLRRRQVPPTRTPPQSILWRPPRG